MLAVTGYLAYTTFQHVTQIVVPPGCQAGHGRNAVSLDTQQAGIAGTIAGVAVRDGLPRQALTVAYAAALQESGLHNVDYGDRDSVGVFQQRPSQGWGTVSDLENPVYAATRFFAALVRVRGYLTMSPGQAAQAVQHSADGSAYSQYGPMASTLASAFTGQRPHSVWCWYGSGPREQANLAAAGLGLAQAFGTPGADGPLVRFTTSRSARSPGAAVQVRPAAAWTVASWLVTHADSYGIRDVRCDGYEWVMSHGGQGWRPAAGRTGGSILLH